MLLFATVSTAAAVGHISQSLYCTGEKIVQS